MSAEPRGASSRGAWFVWRRAIPALLLGEIVPVVVLVATVALWGPADPVEARAFARRMGMWIGPLAAAVTIVALTTWAGQVSSRPVRQGALIGLTLAVVDLSILLGSGEALVWPFVGSNLGRVLAGSAGGLIASSTGARDPREAAL